MGTPLLGEHPAIVDRLAALVHDLSDTGYAGPRVVVLLGESGCGKTRVIQELYERLREIDPYWPPLAPADSVADSRVDPMASRKLVAPPVEPHFEWPAGALPTFGWWGLNCERLNHGATQDVVLAMRTQLNAHALPLALAYRDLTSFGEKSKNLSRDIVTRIRDAAVDEGLGAIGGLLESVGVVIPFAGTLVKWGWTGIRAAQRHHAELQLRDTYVDLGSSVAAEKAAAGSELARVLASTAHRQLPSIVAIEDIHVMGDELRALLDGLAEAERPVLVVCTAWPEGTSNPPYAAWLTSAQKRGLAQVWEVPKLGADSLKQILLAEAPQTSPEVADRVVRQLPNPHLLKLWLSVRLVKAGIRRHGGAVVLGEGDLELPSDIRQVLAQRWDELEAPIREALLYAAAVNPLDDPTCRFVPGLVAAVAVAFDDEIDAESIDKGLAEAAGEAGWCRVTGTDQQFTEALLAHHARDESRVFREVVAELHEICFSRLSQWLLDRADGLDLALSEESTTATRWWLALAPEPTDDASVEQIRAIALGYQSRLAHEVSNDLVGAAELAGAALEAAQRADLWLSDGAFAVRQRQVDCLHQAGYLDRAAELREGLLVDQTAVLGPHDHRTLTNRYNAAVAAFQGGGPIDGSDRAAFLALVGDLERSLGPEHSLVMVAQQTVLAIRLNEGEEPESIIADAQDLLDRQRRSGRVVPLTVQVLAAALQRSGRAEQAEAVVRTLLDEQVGAHPGERLRTRGWLVDHAEARGDLAAAIAEQRAILEEKTTRYGADHRELWVVRTRLADLMAAHAQVDEAVELLRTNVARTDLAGGPLLYRAHLARRLEQWGRPGEALAEFQVALADVAAVEADNGSWLTDTSAAVREDVARLLAAVGRHEEAAATYSDLVRVADDTHGPASHGALLARYQLAEQLRRARSFPAAVAAYQEVLARLDQDRGPDHDDTRNVRLALAQAQTGAGQWQEALTTYEDLLVDLPQDHPMAFNARYGVASHLALTGQPAKAVPMYRRLVDECTQQLGDQHPTTVQLRQDLDDLLGELPDADDQA